MIHLHFPQVLRNHKRLRMQPRTTHTHRNKRLIHRMPHPVRTRVQVGFYVVQVGREVGVW